MTTPPETGSIGKERREPFEARELESSPPASDNDWRSLNAGLPFQQAQPARDGNEAHPRTA